MNKAYVVGYGIIDALGNTPDQCFSRMLDNNDYSSDMQFMIDENHKITRGFIVPEETINLPNGAPRGMTKALRLGFYAADQALAMSELPHSDNVSVVFSTIVNDTETLTDLSNRMLENRRVPPRMILNRIPDMMASYIAQHYQFLGTTAAMSCACATGIVSIDYAMRLLDEYDYVIVGATDAGCCPVSVKAFAAMGAMGNVSRPFDVDREGFVMGEGAAVLILQSKHMVQKYNSQVYATLYPAGIANDAYDETNPDPNGRGAHLAIKKALQDVTGAIHAVNAHATSTPVGDGIEYNTVVEHFGCTPIYAPKSKIGHTMAGSGIVEAVYAIESMRRGIVPHIHNLKTTDIDRLNCLARDNQQLPELKTLRTINNSFGFGGKCASQVIEVTLP